MTKITEMIPNNMPEWAWKAMKEGQLFNEVFKRIKRLEEESIHGLKKKSIGFIPYSHFNPPELINFRMPIINIDKVSVKGANNECLLNIHLSGIDGLIQINLATIILDCMKTKE